MEILGPIKHGAAFNTCCGGFFGYSGEFALADGSMAKVYATSWGHMVKVTAYKGDPYLLSPLDPELFVQAVRQCCFTTGEKAVIK